MLGTLLAAFIIVLIGLVVGYVQLNSDQVLGLGALVIVVVTSILFGDLSTDIPKKRNIEKYSRRYWKVQVFLGLGVLIGQLTLIALLTVLVRFVSSRK